MNVIFLDFDGVVNNLVWFEDENRGLIYNYNKYITITDACGGKRHIPIVNDFQAMCWLNQLCKGRDIEIVVTSTWRLHHDYVLALRKGGLAEKVGIFGCTDCIHTEDYYRDRGREINKFLEEHPDIQNYLILDDEDCFFDEQKPFFVKCEHNGFNYPEYKKAIDIIANKWNMC